MMKHFTYRAYAILFVGFFLANLNAAASVALPPIDKGIGKKNLIYAQGSISGFDEIALRSLFDELPQLRSKIVFTGKLHSAISQSVSQNGLVFIPLRNSTYPTQFMSETLDELRYYQITDLIGLITIPINLCVYMNSDEIADKQPMRAIASSVNALSQMSQWISRHHLQTIATQMDTSMTAKQLAHDGFPQGTAVAATCDTDQYNPRLKRIAQSVQDKKTNRTTYVLVKLVARPEPVDKVKVDGELTQWIVSYLDK